MSIEALKEQARRHEQKEEWQKALAQYTKAIDQLADEEQPDIGLYNRVGDLYVRVGELDAAVQHYEQSVDLYMDAYLPNNAIAVCKKIIRNVPDRHEAYLRMGQIRGEQGFIPDARTNFLTYAERKQQDGDIDESFRALVEFCDLAPEETDMRIVVAEQMASHDRVEDAVAQLLVAHAQLTARGEASASDLEAKILELDPTADLTTAAVASIETGGDLDDSDDLMGQFGEIAHAEEDESEVVAASDGASDLEAGGDGEESDEEAMELPTFEISGDEDEDEGEPMELPTFDVGEDEDEGEPMELPTFDVGEDEDEGEPMELPTFDMGDDEDEGEPMELPTFDMGDDEAGELPTLDAGVEEEVAVPLPELGADAGSAIEDALEEVAADVSAQEDEALTIEDVRARIAVNPSDVAQHQRMVELAYGVGDDGVLAEAFLGLAQALDSAGETARAQAAYQQVLQADPSSEVARAALSDGPAAQPVREVAANEDYVDLGAMILGDEPEKTTRFQVAYEEPSGDEAADFAKMLSQFKDKVSENLDVDDVKAHHDLGTAYKEMGLLDEAISEFQAALRASSEHLATYELLGQTFLEMNQPEAAVNSLRRALDVDYEIEDDLVGIYYYLARAHESLDQTPAAIEFYDKVFSLDINFADVTERLRALR